jgi:outer membrane protein assembly factor BamB
MKRQMLIGLLVPILAGCSTVSFKAPTGASQLPVVAATKDSGNHPVATPSPRPTVLPDGAVTLSTDPAVSYRINPTHAGFQAANLTSRRLGKRWSRDLGGVVSYPLVASGKIFVTVANAGSYGSALVALDEKTGRTVWGPIDLGGTYNFSGAAYDQGKVFVVNGDGLLRSFDANYGTPGWSIKAEGQYSFGSAPTASGGSVYLVGAGSGGTMYAFSEASGATRWTAPVVGTDSSPAVSTEGVFTAFACGHADDFDPSTGTRIWHHNAACSGGGGATAVLYQGKVYVRDSISGNLTLDARTGNAVGTFSATTNPAFSGKTGFFLSGETLRSLDLGSGTIQWSFAGDGSLVSAPVVAGDTVYVASSSGIVYALNAPTGRVVAEVDTQSAISATDEHNAVQRTGLAVGDGLLLVPAGTVLLAY